jgi:hypothetical protein
MRRLLPILQSASRLPKPMREVAISALRGLFE